jgi:ssDNA-binding replication factor A large subunit
MAITKISDLNDGDKGVSVEGMIIKVEEPREITTKFGRTKVMNVSISDDTDRILLTLWGEDCDKVQEGDKVRIENGFVKMWNGEKQLNVGRFGKIKKIQ